MKAPGGTSIATSAILVVAMRWADRLIGILSTLVLARLLVPADFGIVAMASVLVGLIDVMLDFGVHVALIQNRQAGAEDYHAAWTLRLLQSLAAAALVAALAHPAAGFFDDARVSPVLLVMAVTTALSGLENIGIVDFQKGLRFGADFRFFFTRRVVGFIVTMVLALTLRTYWAMVLGALAGRTCGVVLSYLMHEFRPRFSFQRFGSLWSISQWVLMRNVAVYADAHLDRLFLGRGNDAAAVGRYSIAAEIAAMPTSELLMPLNRVLFPAFAAMAEERGRLIRAVRTALGVQASVALPAACGLALVAPLAIPLVLGEQWTGAIELVQVLAVTSALGALGASSSNLLLALGKVRLQASVLWAQVGIFVLAVVWMLPDVAPFALALVRLAIAAAGLFALLAMVVKTIDGLDVAALLAETWRPLLASAAMLSVLHAVPPPNDWSTMSQLSWMIALGALCYALCLLALWRLAGLPEGAEAYLLATLRERLGRRDAPAK